MVASALEAFKGDRGLSAEVLSLNSCTVFWGLGSDVVGFPWKDECGPQVQF